MDWVFKYSGLRFMFEWLTGEFTEVSPTVTVAVICSA
jgi:hypothetical protein